MKTHRYFVEDLQLSETVVVEDEGLLKQWNSVLRYTPGREVELFNGEEQALFTIEGLSKSEASLVKKQELPPKRPDKELYLCFALLKKDKTEWVLQKATELGVTHFVPLITQRTEKTGWNEDRSRKIVIEASEQCERTDIPELYPPQELNSVVDMLKDKECSILVTQMGAPGEVELKDSVAAVLIGPEGGWSDEELEMFDSEQVKKIGLSNYTLRAETAAIAAVVKLT